MIKVTIITVAYNAVSTIEQTMLSVINQSYSNIEYIIIDGGSKDGTVDVIKKYINKIAYWVSEPDKGIYDAMNKGILHATGEWVNFMNSGDSFYNEHVIQNVFSRNLLSYSVVYGKTIVKQKWGTYIVIPDKLTVLLHRMPFYHQSTFVRVDCARQYSFDLNYKITADYNMFNFLYKNNFHFYYYDDMISIYDSIFGVSSVNLVKMNNEIDKVAKQPLMYSKIFRKIRLGIISYLPDFFINYLYRFYYFVHKRFIEYSEKNL